MVALSVDHAKGQSVQTHTHERGQLMFVVSGSMRITTREGTWVTPPGRAFWIPAGIHHSVVYPQPARLHTAYIRHDLLHGLPARCRVLKLSPLLRELVIRAAASGWEYTDDSPQARLMQVLIDQIAEEKEAPLFLPEARDHRVRRVTQALQENPGDTRPLEQWCHLAGASSRTLSRLFLQDTGMTFTAWRQQLCLISAVELLLEGQSVTQIALRLGYASTGSFTSMFSRVMGAPPTAYLNRWEQA
ncbi:transcriptional regulator, AraC family [Methylovorus sp. MP688]|nr:transcriptional regulator, AraC family [Methylovorus sp. MP688]